MSILKKIITTGLVLLLLCGLSISALADEIQIPETIVPEFSHTPEPEEIPAQINVSVGIASAAEKKTVYQVGERINFRIVVTNTGGQTLSQIAAVDTLTGMEKSASELAAGKSLEYTASYLITEEDSDAQAAVEIVRVSAVSLPDRSPVSDEDTIEVPVSGSIYTITATPTPTASPTVTIRPTGTITVTPTGTPTVYPVRTVTPYLTSRVTATVTVRASATSSTKTGDPNRVSVWIILIIAACAAIVIVLIVRNKSKKD